MAAAAVLKCPQVNYLEIWRATNSHCRRYQLHNYIYYSHPAPDRTPLWPQNTLTSSGHRFIQLSLPEPGADASRMLVILYGVGVIWLLLWHLWWKIHHRAVCNTVLTLKSGQQAASSLHTDGDCLATRCLPFQTVLSAGLLLLRWIRKTHKPKAEYSACSEPLLGFLTFLKQFTFARRA